jgi:hypothetical protein
VQAWFLLVRDATNPLRAQYAQGGRPKMIFVLGLLGGFLVVIGLLVFRHLFRTKS